MAASKIRITGELKKDAVPESTETLTLEETYYISAATRGEVAPRHEIDMVDAQGVRKIIEFTYQDNTVWIGDITTIDEIFPGTSAQVRSIEDGGDDTVEIPTEIFVGEPNRSGLFTKIGLKIVKIFTKKSSQTAS